MIGNVWEWTRIGLDHASSGGRGQSVLHPAKIRAAGRRPRATTHASRRSAFPARCSRAVRIYARRTIAGATGRPPGTPSRSTLRPATSDSAASCANLLHVDRRAIHNADRSGASGGRAACRPHRRRHALVRHYRREPWSIVERHPGQARRPDDIPLHSATGDGDYRPRCAMACMTRASGVGRMSGP